VATYHNMVHAVFTLGSKRYKYTLTLYDMILYDIFVNCNWVDTRCQ